MGLVRPPRPPVPFVDVSGACVGPLTGRPAARGRDSEPRGSRAGDRRCLPPGHALRAVRKDVRVVLALWTAHRHRPCHCQTVVGYPPTAVGYPPTAVGYPPTAVGYPPTVELSVMDASSSFFSFCSAGPRCTGLVLVRDLPAWTPPSPAKSTRKGGGRTPWGTHNAPPGSGRGGWGWRSPFAA